MRYLAAAFGVILICTQADASSYCQNAVRLELSNWWSVPPKAASRSDLAAKQVEVDRVKEFAATLHNACYRDAYRDWISTAQSAIDERMKELDE